MQLQRQAIRIVEESHLLAGVIIHADWLTFNPDLCQPIHCLFHAINAERKVTQPTGLRAVHTLRWILFSENFQLRVFINTKIQLPILTLWAVVLSDDRESQLVHIKILGGFIVRYNNCNMMYF